MRQQHNEEAMCLYVSNVLSNEQKTIKGQGEIFSHPMNHQGILHGLKSSRGT